MSLELFLITVASLNYLTELVASNPAKSLNTFGSYFLFALLNFLMDLEAISYQLRCMTYMIR